jgi:hypothetical protein
MYKKLLLILLFLVCSTTGYGQGSNVSDSVRAMIERSQASSQFEQTARMQLSMQYQGFLNALSGGAQRRSQIEAVFVEVLTERAELSSRVSRGEANVAELKTVGGYAYLRARLAPLLSTTELSALDSQKGGPSDEQLKKEYSEQLSRSAGGLSAATRELVLDTLIKHIQTGEGDAAELGQSSVDDLVARQIQSFMQVGEELQSQLSSEQMQQVTAFLGQLQTSLYRNRSMLDQ